PRAPREIPPGEEGDDDNESIGSIFKEAREQRAADDARRGVTSRGSRSGGPGAGRSGGRSEGRRDGAPRRERTRSEDGVAKPADAAVAGAEAAAPRPPRKPRVEGAVTDAAHPGANPAEG
ncbi:ATP-dependent RNA helicase RhlB, partial [Lysobacter sp. ISL-54]